VDFLSVADSVKDKLKLLRRLSKKEQFDLELLSKFLGKNKLKLAEVLMKRGKAVVTKKKLDLSFLISGSTLMPCLVSETENMSDLNSAIERKYKEELFDDFSERAFDVVPQFMAPNRIGFVEEKQATALSLFSDLKLLFVGDGIQLLNSARKIDADLAEDIIFSKQDKSNMENYNFVFFPKAPESYSFEDIVDKVLVDNQKPVSWEDIDFIKSYLDCVRANKVKLPKHLFEHVRKFVRRKRASKPSVKVGEEFVRGVVELAKASARIEMRKFVTHKDLERAFRIAEKANKR